MSLNHSPFGPFRNPLDDDSWTEIADATIPRMDLVGKAANGSRGFLLMKGDGLLDPTEVRRLVAKTTSSKKERTVPKVNRVAVYNSSGQLVGTVDPTKITAVGVLVAPGEAAAPVEAPVDETAAWKAKNAAQLRARGAAPVTPEDATDGPAAVTKAVEVFAPMVRNLNQTLAGARFAGDSSVFARGTTEQRFAKLTQTVDPRTAGSLTDEVLRGAMSGMFGAGFSNNQAVLLAKRIALDAATRAADQVREVPEVALKRIHQSNPTNY
jgi:hypothetical protein